MMEVLVVAVLQAVIGQVQEEVGLVEMDPQVVEQGVVSVPEEEHMCP
jgi:hypothetical protein